MIKERRNLLLTSLWCFLMTFIIISFVAMTFDTHTSPELCVDGDGDKNLEGIMCEKTTITFIDEDLPGQSFLTILVLLSCGSFVLGLISFMLFLLTWGNN